MVSVFSVSSKDFIVSDLTFRILVQFEFIFVYGVRFYLFIFFTCSCRLGSNMMLGSMGLVF